MQLPCLHPAIVDTFLYHGAHGEQLVLHENGFAYLALQNRWHGRDLQSKWGLRVASLFSVKKEWWAPVSATVGSMQTVPSASKRMRESSDLGTRWYFATSACDAYLNSGGYRYRWGSIPAGRRDSVCHSCSPCTATDSSGTHSCPNPRRCSEDNVCDTGVWNWKKENNIIYTPGQIVFKFNIDLPLGTKWVSGSVTSIKDMWQKAESHSPLLFFLTFLLKANRENKDLKGLTVKITYFRIIRTRFMVQFVLPNRELEIWFVSGVNWG